VAIAPDVAASSPSLDRLSSIRNLTGHTKPQVKPIASSINLDVTQAATWSNEDCDRFRDAVFVDKAIASKAFASTEDARKALETTIASCGYSATDEAIFEAFMAAVERVKSEGAIVDAEVVEEKAF
jgi:hypothetical protein